MKNRNLPVDDNWMTPEWLYNELFKEFRFTHDPCPYTVFKIDEKTDGLNYNNPWGKINYVNPPYSRNLKEAFIERAIIEKGWGHTSVMLLPVSTSTKVFHDLIKPNADEIRFLRGRIKFEKLN